MTSEWLVPHLLTTLELIVAVLLGYSFGRGSRKVLQREIVELRAELKSREDVLTARSKREDKMVHACLERLGASMADASPTNIRVDLSREAVAVNMEEERRLRTREENQQEWEEELQDRRATSLADIAE